MITRYDTYGLDWKCETYADEKGPLVAYEDYQKLESEIKELRQQLKAVKPEQEDGWIEWGGNCDGNDQPVIGVVEVEFRNGCTNKARACDLYWPHDGCSSDIIAYRVVR